MRLRPSLSWMLLGLFLLALLPSVQAQVVTDYGLSLGEFSGIVPERITGSAVSSTDLNLSYDLETLDGGLMNDFSTEGNDGTINGASDIAGRFGRARDFDGIDDSISMDGLITNLATNTEGTIAFWAFIEADDESQNMVISFTRDADAIATSLSLSFDLRSGSDFLSAHLIADGTDVWRFHTSLDSSDAWIGTWVPFAIVQNGTEPVIYVNGTVPAQSFIDETDKTQWVSSILADASSPSDSANIGVFESNGADILFFNGIIDEFLIFSRALSPSEILCLAAGPCMDYTYRFDSETLVPADVVNGTSWIRGSNITWGAVANSVEPVTFTANASVWFEGTTTSAFSWDSFSNVSAKDIGFNFTVPTGTYPYWVNDTFQTNLTTVAGAIAFNWTDWTDGEHLFEFGFEISSTPITSATVGLAFVYAPTITKTNITWSLETGPAFLAIDPSSGIIAGVPLAPQVAVVTIRATANGGLFLEQTFALIILEVGVLTDAQTMIIWLSTLLMFILFVVGPVFRMWFLWMLGGIDGILFGLFVFSALESFPLAIIIMGFGGFLLVGGILLTISQAVRGAIAGREV